MRYRNFTSVLSLIAICLNLSYAQQIKIFKPKEIKFAKPFSLIIEIDQGFKITSVSTSTISATDFDFIGFKIKESKVIFDTIAFNVGISTFPSLTLMLDGEPREIKTPPLPLKIEPLYNPKEDSQLKDIAGIFEFLWWLKIIIILIIILLIYLLYRKLSRKKTNPINELKIDTRTPYEKAIDRLKELINKKLIEQDKIKEFYTELSDIVRIYIEEEFKINATQLTTQELLRRLKNDTGIEIIIKLREILEISDLVKFAKYIPEIEKINRNIKQTEDILSLIDSYLKEKRKKEEEIKQQQNISEKEKIK